MEVVLSLNCKLFLSLITTALCVPLFPRGFLSLIASLRATGVDVLLYGYSQLVLLRHSNDRLASCCLVAVPTFKIISLAER